LSSAAFLEHTHSFNKGSKYTYLWIKL
jgi:hypothetical protein